MAASLPGPLLCRRGGKQGARGRGMVKAAGFLGRAEFSGETLYRGSAEAGRGQKETGFSGGPEVSRGQVGCEEAMSSSAQCDGQAARASHRWIHFDGIVCLFYRNENRLKAKSPEPHATSAEAERLRSNCPRVQGRGVPGVEALEMVPPGEEHR